MDREHCETYKTMKSTCTSQCGKKLETYVRLKSKFPMNIPINIQENTKYIFALAHIYPVHAERKSRGIFTNYISVTSFYLFIFGHTAQLVGSYFSDQGLNLGPWQ